MDYDDLFKAVEQEIKERQETLDKVLMMLHSCGGHRPV